MASPFVKSQLKRARELIASKDFEGAATAARCAVMSFHSFIDAHASYSEVLKYESANYNARVFLALALLNLGKHEEAEATYRKAIQGSPEQLLAWQVCLPSLTLRCTELYGRTGPLELVREGRAKVKIRRDAS